MKTLKKIIAFVAAFIGAAALCALDSDVPLWGTLLMVVIGIAGFFGGIALWCANSDEPLID